MHTVAYLGRGQWTRSTFHRRLKTPTTHTPGPFYYCHLVIEAVSLCVPCAEVLLLEASAGLVAALQFSGNFHAIFRNWI